jgi:hypothetical protein
MAGVAGPMLHRTRSRGARFLAGLALGGAIGGLVLSVPVYLLGVLTGAFPAGVRAGLLVVACMVFGIADLRGRTPHVWRQVPQAYVRSLPPGRLGLVWGFDLGLLVTTQKTTSLIWVAGAAVVLLRPDMAAVTLAAIATVAAAAITANALTGLLPQGREALTWSRPARWVSGGLILAMPALLVIAPPA